MMHVAVDWLPYTLPLKRRWQTSRGVFGERHGHLLRLRINDGRTGWGDCAPLPEFGIAETSASRFAKETAALDLTAQKAGLPMNSWLSGNQAVASTAVNANLGDISSTDHESVAASIESGFSILKLKVGICHWKKEIAHLQQLSLALPPGIKFRLDANGALTAADATQFVAACCELPVEGLEEPLQAPSRRALSRLQDRADFPIAIDESCQLIDTTFFRHPPVRRLTLKPARHGGLLATIKIARQAQAAGIECIVTSSLESNCGLLACTHLAAAIAPQATHGLGTAGCFTKNTGAALKQYRGRIFLPSTAGLGFLPNPQFTETRIADGD